MTPAATETVQTAPDEFVKPTGGQDDPAHWFDALRHRATPCVMQPRP